MKKGFTIVEVSILFVIFLIVAFLVAPLSLDDTMQAKTLLAGEMCSKNSLIYSML